MNFRERGDIQQAFQTIDGQIQKIGKIIDRHSSMINDHQKFINKETARQILQAEKDIISHSIDKGKIYTQGLLAGGYAGFFAFWAFMKNKMNDFLFAGSGFFMVISLSVFIFYTVWQNIASNRIIMERVGAMLEATNDPERYLQIKEKYEEKIKDWHRRTFRAWNVILFITIIPAGLALCLLLWGYIIFLVEPFDWNGIIETIKDFFIRFFNYIRNGI